jgi:uncharacterized repeat protein (TIGR01451 family)
MKYARSIVVSVVLVSAGLFAQASTAAATPIDTKTVIRNTDFASFGVGAMRGSGSGALTVAGVSPGTVTKALLYWNGPTNSAEPSANASVTFADHGITGINIGTSSDNCWGYINGQSYRADVTSYVSGNGSYALNSFVKTGPPLVDVNGASLIVFFDDGNQTNNKDVTIVDGNDSNIANGSDPAGWDVTIPGIDYGGGQAHIQLHVSDGQSFPDGAVTLNGTDLATAGQNFDGNSVPGNFAAGQDPNLNGSTGNLWDIKNYPIPSGIMASPSTTLHLTSLYVSDCLSLVTALVDVPSTADLSISKSGAPDPVLTNGTLTYTINVANSGFSSAHNVLVHDTLPSGTTFVSASGTGWSCVYTSSVDCSLPMLAVGLATPITITVTAPSSPGTITNNASVTAAEQDPNSANNFASATTTVNNPQADLSIAKSDTAAGYGPDPVSSGQVVAYQVLVTNNGPSTATGITVNDSATRGTIVGASGTHWSCSFTLSTATCARASGFDSLASGATAEPITLQVKAPTTSAQTTINDTSTVSGSQGDPNSDNNTAVQSTTVNPTNTPDFAAGFYDGTHTLDIHTAFGSRDSFRSEIIVPPSTGTAGYQASPVTDQEKSATDPTYIRFCAGQCDAQVDVSFLPSGSQANTTGDPGPPIRVILYYRGDAIRGDAVYARGDGQTSSHLLSKCDRPTVATVHGVVTKCVASDTTKEGGERDRDTIKKIVVLVPSGNDPTIGKK